MRSAINRLVIRIVDPLDNIRLLADSCIGKNRVRGSQIFQVGLERTDVDGWTVRDILRNPERVANFLHHIQPGELPNAHTHGVARMDQTV